MYDPTSTYRTDQIVTATPVGQVVLLLQGAIRFGRRHIEALEQGDRQAAHTASIRCQAIVAGLQEVLDLRAGPIAAQRDAIYDCGLRRLVEGNLRADPRPTEEAIGLLRDLLEAWTEVAARQRAGELVGRQELAAVGGRAVGPRALPA